MTIPTNSVCIVDIMTIRARFRHTYLTHSYLFKHEEQPLYHQCDVLLTIENLTLHCLIYNGERRFLSQDPNNMKKVLGETTTDVIYLFFNTS